MYDEEVDSIVKIITSLREINEGLISVVKDLQNRVSNLEEKMNDR